MFTAMLIASSSGCCSWKAATEASDVATARNLTFHGLNALHRGDADQATGLLRQACDACPTDQRIRQHLASAMVQNGSVDGAILQLNEALEHSPHDPRLHVELGNLLLRRNQVNLANKHAEIALRIEQQYSGAWKLKGHCQTTRGELDEAITSFHRACSCENACPSLHLEVAKIYRHQNKPLQALNALSLYNDRFPSDQVPMDGILMMSDTMADLNQHQRANLLLAEAVERNDATEQVWLALSRSQANLGDLSEAMLTNRRAARVFPESKVLQTWATELASRSSNQDAVDRTAALPRNQPY